MECEDCNGKGTVEYGPVCGMPASMCCGGCYQTVICETCDGSGKIEIINEED
jgi:hypothetical protein